MSRAPSRSTTPGPAISRSASSRLTIPPTLRSSPSLTSLKVHSHNAGSSTVASTAQPSVISTTQTLDSSASSVVNMDMNEGILVQDVEAEVDTMEEDAVVERKEDSKIMDEENKKLLRDKLRKTLSHKASRPEGLLSRTPSKNPKQDASELLLDAATKYPPREYFVLTDAGKPVFTSRSGSDDSDDLTSTIGIIQALISVFIDDGDKLRCINAGKTRMAFLQRTPLYYVCVSSWGEPESVTRSHLEYLHLQILSIVTAAQLRKIFERRTNFDLRRLLNGAETFLTAMINRLEFDLAMSTSSLHCMRLDPTLRKRAAEALVPATKMKDVLYMILIAQSQVITLIRPKKHSIHPADLHILLNTMQTPSVANSPAAAQWIPVCLPKFNPSGFVNAYISHLTRDVDQTPRPSMIQSAERQDRAMDLPIRDEYSGLSLVCISGGGEFETVRTWCSAVTKKLEDDGTLVALCDTLQSGKAEYTVSELGIPGLRHFIYKSRPQVQVTFPVFEDPYDTPNEKRRITTLYQILHDAIHAKSGQEQPLKLQYIRTDKECVMGWITQPFELYITLSPLLPKSAVVGAANSVARWVKKDENKLFLRDAPIF
ncbi:Vacuolar fusion protein mon1 [Stygiomarasmius scandens]|uniref:Vacuolar fusion protein MON1 n=1 Tax=Marasmiellus scandens TaxID=2682957 RepID=A0ABR1JYK0_9AGAR